jgi:hypothetical protein
VTAAALAHNDSARIESLIDVVARLAAVLGEETAAVRARDYRRLVALSDQKGRLAESFGRRLGELGRAGPDAPPIEPQLGARLSALVREFTGLLETNARTLGAARSAHERLIRSIGEAVAAKARPVRGYSQSGGYRAEAPSDRTQMLPIALNQKV